MSKSEVSPIENHHFQSMATQLDDCDLKLRDLLNIQSELIENLRIRNETFSRRTLRSNFLNFTTFTALKSHLTFILSILGCSNYLFTNQFTHSITHNPTIHLPTHTHIIQRFTYQLTHTIQRTGPEITRIHGVMSKIPKYLKKIEKLRRDMKEVDGKMRWTKATCVRAWQKHQKTMEQEKNKKKIPVKKKKVVAVEAPASNTTQITPSIKKAQSVECIKVVKKTKKKKKKRRVVLED